MNAARRPGLRCESWAPSFPCLAPPTSPAPTPRLQTALLAPPWNTTSPAHYFVDTLLQFHGLLPGQYTLVHLEATDQIGPLLRGEIDAVGLLNPGAYLILKTLGSNAVLIPDPRIFTFTANLVGVTIAAGGRDENVIKLLRALKRGLELIRKDPARARAIIAPRLKLDLAGMETVWGDYNFELSLAQPLITALEAQARWALRENLVPGGKMPDYLDYVRPEPLKKVDRRAVTLVK